MNVAVADYLQTFKTLSLPQQMQLSQAINQYLLEYFDKLTTQLEEEERSSWLLLSQQQLAKAYSNDEPEYSLDDLQHHLL